MWHLTRYWAMQDTEKSLSSIGENKNELERKFNVQCDISSVFQSGRTTDVGEHLDSNTGVFNPASNLTVEISVR